MSSGLINRTEISGDFSESTTDLFAATANVESKTLAIGVMALENGWMTSSDIRSSLRDRAGGSEQSFWLPSASVFKNYCNVTFEPVGAVVKGNKENGGANIYKVDDEKQDLVLAVVGLSAHWGLTYPEQSLQSIYGRTSRSARAETRAITGRINVLSQLIKQPGSAITESSAYIPGTPERGASYATSVFDALEAAELIDVTTKTEHNDRQYEVVAPDKKNMTLYTYEEYMRLSTRVALDWLETLPAGARFTFEEAYNNVASVLTDRKIGFEAARVRAEVGDFFGTKRFPAQVRPTNTQVTHKHTSARIKEEHQPAIEDAVAIYKAVAAGDEVTLAFGREQARTILNSPHAVSTLLDKSYDHSAAAHRQAVENTNVVITNILHATDKLDAPSLRTSLEERGIQVSTPRLRTILGALSVSGTIDIRFEPRHSATRQKRNYYSLRQA